ncbi:MAG: prepilin peptidase [Mycobacterium sp.]
MGSLPAAACGAVVVWAAALSIADLRRHRLPNALTVPGAVAILVGWAMCGRGPAAVLGALALGGLYLAVHLADPAGLGGGDVKLAVGLGALTGALGAPVWLLAALGAPLLTAAGCLLGGRGGTVPHGPSMLLASLTAAALAVL